MQGIGVPGVAVIAGSGPGGVLLLAELADFRPRLQADAVTVGAVLLGFGFLALVMKIRPGQHAVPGLGVLALTKLYILMLMAGAAYLFRNRLGLGDILGRGMLVSVAYGAGDLIVFAAVGALLPLADNLRGHILVTGHTGFLHKIFVLSGESGFGPFHKASLEGIGLGKTLLSQFLHRPGA